MDEPERKKACLARLDSDATVVDSQDTAESQDNGTLEYDMGITEGAEHNDRLPNLGSKKENVCENGEAGGASKSKLAKIESVARDAQHIVDVLPHVNVEAVYEKVLQSRSQTNRVDIVTNEVLESDSVTLVTSTTDSGGSITSSASDEIFRHVAEILVKHPDADPSYVYDLLDKEQDKEQRVELVLNKLSMKKGNNESVNRSDSAATDVSSSKSSNSVETSDPFDDPEFKKNPLYKEFKTLRRVLPEVNPNELYAYLEAHFDKPNKVEIVINELKKSESQDSVYEEQEHVLDILDKGKGPQTDEDRLQLDLNELKTIFKDCDPNFLFEKLVTMPCDKERVQKIAEELFENKNYPKLKDILESEKKRLEKKKITDMHFDMKEFLSKFPDPVQYFSNEERPVSDNYKAHVSVYLKNTYPHLKAGFIKKVLQAKNHHLVPAVQEVELTYQATTGNPVMYIVYLVIQKWRKTS